MTDRCQDEISMGHAWPPAVAYQLWLAAAKDAEHALHAWLDGAPRTQAAPYLAYRAALDREEAAASDLERLSVSAGATGAAPARAPSASHRFAAPVVDQLPQRGSDG